VIVVNEEDSEDVVLKEDVSEDDVSVEDEDDSVDEVSIAEAMLVEEVAELVVAYEELDALEDNELHWPKPA